MQVIRISARVLGEVVYFENSRCTNSVSGYYGCFYLTSKQLVQPGRDDKFLSINYASNLTFDRIST